MVCSVISGRRRKMRKLTVALMAVMCLPLAACSDSSKVIGYSSPNVIAADGREYSLPVSQIYQVSYDTLERSGSEAVCKAAGVKYTPENADSICFGENVFGIGLASVVYFGKYTSSLSDEEWQKMSEIASSPESFSIALTGKSISGISPQAQYASRIPENAYFDAMVEQIVGDITEQQNCDRSQAFRMLYSEGVTVTTPFSPSMQEAVDKVYGDPENFSDSYDFFPQSACAVTDMNGNVIAVAAGNHGNSAYNRACRTLHRIGSSIKPLSVYSPALAERMISFSSQVMDEPMINSNTPYAWPRNYNLVYDGRITVTYALRQSKNTVPVLLASELGGERCLAFMREKLGFTTLTDRDADISSISLGYLERGVSMTELAAAYSIFGRGGSYSAPSFYTRVTDSDGKVLAECRKDSIQSLSSADAWIMNRLLYYNICKDDGIAQAARLSDGSEVIGKTGTVDNDAGNDTDRLFVGLTPEYCAAVWIGYDDKDSVIDRTEYKLPASIWKGIMELADRNEAVFTPDESVMEADYCTVSGMLAGAGCTKKETGFYRDGELPGKCNIH